ncbi:MAG: PIN domain-containing protein [Betaproteobacteria bacterium]|nr:PIN domain-containing protein [Betaproteobacteria bacterium]
MRALLDVNVWIALLDDAHVFSDRANAWLQAQARPIATCPIIENGVARILSSPAYSKEASLTPGQVTGHLRTACAQMDHAFWPDDLSLRDQRRFDFSRLHGHRQITDAYLLALAVDNDGCLVTLDESLALGAVRGATRKHLRQI